MQFCTLGSSKVEVSETCFFDIVTTQNDHPTYLKHAVLTCVSHYLGIGSGGGGGGVPKGPVQNLLAYAVLHPWHLKIEVSETCFFDIMTTQNDHPTYVKHVSSSIYVIFTSFGYWVQGGGGILKVLVHNLLVQFFTLGSSKIEVSDTLF